MRRSPGPSWRSILRSCVSQSASRRRTTWSTTFARPSTASEIGSIGPSQRPFGPVLSFLGVDVAVIRRSWLKRLTAVGRVVTIPLTALVFYALHQWGGIADTPLWALYVILGLAGLTSFLAERRWPEECTRRQLHAR